MRYSLEGLTRWDRPARSHVAVRLSLALAATTLVTSTGCLHMLLATGIYFWEGGNLVDAECEALEDQRVVVFCRPPAAQEFRHAGASRAIAERVGKLIEVNDKAVEVVPQAKVDEWLDENGSEDYEELGRAVKADMVIHIELSHFELFKGKTVYQGNSDVTVSVYDMNDGGRLVFEKEMGEVLFPVHSGVPVQDKPVTQFQREYIGVLSDAIGRHFYRHDPHADFAIDALANK